MYAWLAAPMAALLWISPPAAAEEVEGIALPERVTVAGEPLVLNGAGVRRYFFFKVYVGALYLEERLATPRAVIERPVAKCLRLYFLRDVDAEDITEELLRGVRANTGELDFARLRGRIERLRAAIPDLRAGDRVQLAFLRSARTKAWINGALVADVGGRDFQTAVLLFWLGDHPVDARLKRALLGRS